MKRMPVSLQEFAWQMRQEDAVFAERVARFEAAHGAMHGDLLTVAAQANYLCWGEAEFPASLLRACEAIACGHPRPMTLCLQVSPRRWQDLHHYVVAVQRWLGDMRPVPEALDPGKVARLQSLIGQPTKVRIALARLYLSGLVEQLFSVSFGQLSGDETTDGGTYDDFSAWYARTDGRCYYLSGEETLIEECMQTVRQGMAEQQQEAEELLRELLKQGRPPCALRFPRYQDVRLASIGALRWRGNLPPDNTPQSYWEGLFAQAGAALDDWVGGNAPAGEIGWQIHAALGEPTQHKLDLVTIFLQVPAESSHFFDWLVEHASQSGYWAAHN